MARLDFVRIAGMVTLVLALLLSPATAHEETSSDVAAVPTGVTDDNVVADAATAPDAYLPLPRTMEPVVSHYRVIAVSLGTVAGAIVGNILTSGLMTPILTAGMAAPGLAAATTSAYAVSAITTTFFAGIGAYLGVWATNPTYQLNPE